MKLAVIMPAYRAEATIHSALSSLLRQRSAATLDVIVVDDGSPDRTCDIVRALAKSAPEVRLIEQPHRGISQARNAGLQAISPETDLVGFLDADDLSPMGRIARDVALMRVDPRLDLIYSKVRFFEEEEPALLAPSASSNVLDGRVVQLGAALFRRAIIDRVGLFDQTLLQSEDLDFILRTFELEPCYYLSDEVGVYYRRNHGSITDNRREARHELMKALLRAKKRQTHGRITPLPVGLLTSDHISALQSWVR
jgi:glycosyltransferase involved in cell wall biosynthesis